MMWKDVPGFFAFFTLSLFSLSLVYFSFFYFIVRHWIVRAQNCRHYRNRWQHEVQNGYRLEPEGKHSIQHIWSHKPFVNWLFIVAPFSAHKSNDCHFVCKCVVIFHFRIWAISIYRLRRRSFHNVIEHIEHII